MIGGYHPWYHEEILRRIRIERTKKSAELGEGYAQDFADYRYGCGVIEGLRMAQDIADEIKTEQEKG
jgi:hypothetical protein